MCTTCFTSYVILQKKEKCSYRYDSEHSVSLGVSEQNVYEGDDLQCFSQTHAVSQDTAESISAAKALHWLHQVVVEEPNSTDLREEMNNRIRNDAIHEKWGAMVTPASKAEEKGVITM